mmetsp:Transcript_21541/g.42316  ORF Transcript_21541/g.42316 Transcript_21541/m.42316 type:complete len:254 (-) Transcript_21541:54-815(-)
MAFAQFLGVLVFSYGPIAVLFFGVLARRAQLLLLTLSSAFMCLLSMVVSGIFWFAIKGMQNEPSATIVVGVFFQELARLGLLLIYLRADRHILQLVGHRTDQKRLLNDFSSAVAMGTGFGVMSTILLYGGTLTASLENGDYFTDACPNISGFVASSILALLYQIMHIALMIIFLDGLRRWNSSHPLLHALPRLLGACVLHFLISLLSILNGDVNTGCKVGMPLQAVSVILCVGLSIYTARLPSYMDYERYAFE